MCMQGDPADKPRLKAQAYSDEQMEERKAKGRWGLTSSFIGIAMSEVAITVQHALCLAVTLGVGGVFALEEFLKMAEKVRRASDKAHTAHGPSLTAYFFRDQTPSRSVACWSKKLHPDKTLGEAPQVRYLAGLLYQALRHLFETYTAAASITDRPDPTEYAEYGTAAFADAAGANDEELPLPEPLTPAPDDQAPTGDDPAGGDGPVLGDLSVRLDSGALPKEVCCIRAFDILDLALCRLHTTRPSPRRPWRTGLGSSTKRQPIW